MKTVELQLPDGTPAPATDFGSVPPGTSSASRELRLVHTGDEPITGGLSLWVENEGAGDGEYVVTAQGVRLTAEAQDLLAGAPFLPGEAIALQESWVTPAGVTQTGLDHAELRWKFYR